VLHNLRISAVLLLLLVLPLQGLAASLSHLLCAPPAAGETAQGDHPHDRGHASHDQDGTDSDTGNAGHLACHQLLSGLPSVAVTGPPGFTTAFAPVDARSPALHFLEQPQPVPLA